MKKAKVAAIIQARLGSSRLPLKSLLCLHNLPVIDWVVSRTAKAKNIDKIIVALPETTLDQVLYDHLAKKGIECVTGSENDVLSRFCLASKKSGADYIVRICADNPLIWWEALDRLVDFYMKARPDYAYNHIPKNNLWPDGLGAEIISAELLENLSRLANKTSQREHCLNYIWDNCGQFKIETFDPAESWLKRPDIKLDLDTADDFQRLASLPIYPEIEPDKIISHYRM